MAYGVKKKPKKIQSVPRANTHAAKRLGFRAMIESSGYHKPNHV
jgi:hypothetical protein